MATEHGPATVSRGELAGGLEISTGAAAEPDAPRWVQFAERHKGSAEMFARASAVMPGGVNHNIRLTRPFPLYITRGEGAYKWDVDGNRFLDYAMGSASLLLGHNPPQTRDTLRGVDSFVAAACHAREVEWAEIVCDLIPSAGKVRFCSSGTEATMLAGRIARVASGRKKILRFEGHYHGWGDYYMVGFRPPFDKPSTAGVLPEVLDATWVAADRDQGSIEKLLGTGEVAAVIVEPSGPNWGAVPMTYDQLAFLREVTSRTGTLLIFDEMITGFRWSPGGVQADAGIIPDLTTLGKILSGGLPGGAVAGREDVINVVAPGQGLESSYALHYGTFNGHPLAAAVGTATLQAVSDGEAQAAAAQHAEELRQGLRSILDDLAIDGFPYGDSSTFHLYLRAPGNDLEHPATRENTHPHDYLGMPGQLIEALHCELRLRRLDLMSYNGGVVSAAHGSAELDHALDSFEGALTALRDTKMVAAG